LHFILFLKCGSEHSNLYLVRNAAVCLKNLASSRQEPTLLSFGRREKAAFHGDPSVSLSIQSKSGRWETKSLRHSREDTKACRFDYEDQHDVVSCEQPPPATGEESLFSSLNSTLLVDQIFSQLSAPSFRLLAAAFPAPPSTIALPFVALTFPS
jgi:hypothetical protein